MRVRKVDEADTNLVRKPSKFTETDLRRVFRAARKEGVDVRVEIIPNGPMSVFTTMGAATTVTIGATGPNEWDNV